MGKRKPLRQAHADRVHDANKKSSAKPTPNNDAKDADLEDEDAYWERMEREAQSKKKVVSKKRKVDEESEDDEDSSDSSSDSEESECGIPLDKKVEHISEEYTFEFNDMRESFAEGITTLLKSKMIPNPTAAYEVACSVASQTAVGTAIVCEGGDDVFAFATVLPLINQKNGALYNTLQQFAKALDKPTFSTTSDNATMMLNCIRGSQVNATGLLLHQRFYNLPPELIGHLHRNLDEDLGWAQGRSESVDGSLDGSSAEEHSTFKSIKNMILVAPCTMSTQPNTASSSSSSSSSKKHKGNNEKGSQESKNCHDVTGSTAVIFDNFEDEVYFQEATCSFTFQGSSSDGNIVGTLVTIALLPASSFKSCVQGIAQMLVNSD